MTDAHTEGFGSAGSRVNRTARRTKTPRTTAELNRRRRQILDAIAALGPALPDSLVQRTSRCGNAGCRCRANPPSLHGSYWIWTLTPTRADRTAQTARPRTSPNGRALAHQLS